MKECVDMDMKIAALTFGYGHFSSDVADVKGISEMDDGPHAESHFHDCHGFFG